MWTRFVALSLQVKIVVSVLVVVTAVGVPAYVARGWGTIVFDPTNFAENARSAAAELQQLKNDLLHLHNEATSLLNEAQMLVNEAQMLARLPLDVIDEVTAIADEAIAVYDQARGIGRDVQELGRLFSEEYPEALADLDLRRLDQLTDRWPQLTREAIEDSGRISATAISFTPDTMGRLGEVLRASQNAAGQTAAMQAATQTLGIMAVQIEELQGITAAHARAMEAAELQQLSERAAAEEAQRRFREGLVPPPSDHEPTAQELFPHAFQ
jgi:P-type conjugative transfer protein TrbJ